MKIKKNKKAISQWISYLLIILLTTILAMAVSSWMKNDAKDSAESLEQRIYNDNLCRDISIKAENTTTQNNSIVTYVTNIGNLNIHRLIFESHSNNTIIGNQKKELIIKPDTTKLTFTEQFAGVDELYITPITIKNRHEIICTTKKIRLPIS